MRDSVWGSLHGLPHAKFVGNCSVFGAASGGDCGELLSGKSLRRPFSLLGMPRMSGKPLLSLLKIPLGRRLLQASWKCAAEVCARQGQQRRRIAILPNTFAFHLPLPLSPFFRFPFSTLSLSLSPVLTFASIISIYPSSFLFTITISPLPFLVYLPTFFSSDLHI